MAYTPEQQVAWHKGRDLGLKEGRALLESKTVVMGHDVTAAQWRAFELSNLGLNNEEIATRMQSEGYKVKHRGIGLWKRHPWWKALANEYLEEKQTAFKQFLAEHAEQIGASYLEVLTGKDKGDKTANARVRAVELFLLVGDDPLIKKTPKFVNQTNIQNNTLNISSDELRRKLGGMTQDQMIEYNRTGQLPQGMEAEPQEPIDVTPE